MLFNRRVEKWRRGICKQRTPGQQEGPTYSLQATVRWLEIPVLGRSRLPEYTLCHTISVRFSNEPHWALVVASGVGSRGLAGEQQEGIFCYYESALALDKGLRYTVTCICQNSLDGHLRRCMTWHTDFNLKERTINKYWILLVILKLRGKDILMCKLLWNA